MVVLPVSRERCQNKTARAVPALTSTAFYRLLPSSTVLYRLGRSPRIHAHLVPLLVLVLELDLPVDHREQRVVGPATDVEPGVKFRAPLLHQDAPRAHELAPERFHAEVLRTRVATVAGGADALLVCHASYLSRASRRRCGLR